VSLVDNYGSSFDPNSKTDTTDGVHPTPAGAQKSADVTVAAVIAKKYF
jgi:lysophospholipase L1-like esterase